MKNGLLIFSAPSGSGKSTIVNWLMKEHPELKLAFSISCTSRAPRGTEQNGVEYFFLSPEEFKAKIEADEFLEYEEVYQDRFYGTLKSQVENQLAKGESVIFDVDVKGGVNIKKFYGERALSIFVQPPSVEELRRRLVGRNTDAPEVIEQRLAKASYELTFAPQFDHVVKLRGEGQLIACLGKALLNHLRRISIAANQTAAQFLYRRWLDKDAQGTLAIKLLDVYTTLHVNIENHRLALGKLVFYL